MLCCPLQIVQYFSQLQLSSDLSQTEQTTGPGMASSSKTLPDGHATDKLLTVLCGVSFTSLSRWGSFGFVRPARPRSAWKHFLCSLCMLLADPFLTLPGAHVTFTFLHAYD